MDPYGSQDISGGRHFDVSNHPLASFQDFFAAMSGRKVVTTSPQHKVGIGWGWDIMYQMNDLKYRGDRCRSDSMVWPIPLGEVL